MKKFWRNNALSITFLFLFVFSMIGQVCSGHNLHNRQRTEDGQPALSFSEYLMSGHFVQATFENWESEFLQMMLFVLLTIKLRQKGSSESKKFEEEEVDREPDPSRAGAPWPVRKGGIVLAFYKHSLTIAFALLFLVSFCLHFQGSLKDENEELIRKGFSPNTVMEYVGSSRFWFESFQNWQSEFLSVLAIVVLSIYLRQIGSPQSKPVDASNDETGE
jgi:hypothetical protein